MSIRHSLLAILAQGPCYGYQLRAEFDRRTGSTWPLNVGQVYNTLDRLVRDKLVKKSVGNGDGGADVDATSTPHTYYAVTDAGQHESDQWLFSPLERYSVGRDELALKIALAVTLPGVDAHHVIERQRQATLGALDALTLSAASRAEAADSADFAQELVTDSMQAHAEAELRWLDHVDASLHRAQAEGRASAFPLNTTKPKRGRPSSDSHPEEAQLP
ncbi:PadR family transcriptional regulator [Salinibacterium sp. TMP30]|uniref:PadR family transcriptional regulator n=1 Tax=Salinibacterium sp. TMP30 TaxID=3138237 RepID=UPI00313A07B7